MDFLLTNTSWMITVNVNKRYFYFWRKELLTCVTHLNDYLELIKNDDDGKYCC